MSQIVIVEPNAEIAVLLALTLRMEGYTTATFADAKAALTVIDPA